MIKVKIVSGAAVLLIVPIGIEICPVMLLHALPRSFNRTNRN